MQQAPSSSSVHARLALAWLALAWERLWVRLWLPATCTGLFFAFALTDVLTGLTPFVHVAVVVLAAAGIAALTWRQVKGFVVPSRHEARARLEAESPVGHRPLTAVEDQLVDSGDAVQQALWEAHQRRAREDLARLRAPSPAPNVAARDHFALRAAVILALFVALIGGSGTIGTRLVRNIVPSMVKAGPAVAIKMWITPPAYTGRSPVYVEIPSSDGRDPPKALEIADGSTGLFVVTGAPMDAGVAMDKNLTPLERLADASQHGEFPLKPAKRLEILHGGKPLHGWDVTWIADKPPTIAFTGPASAATRWRLKFDYKASDDYGIQTVTAHMTRPDAQEPLDVELSLPPFASKVITQSPALDLAAHPWAGQKVKLSLKATDQAGQAAESDVIDAILPERVFTHPVAKEIIAQRKALFADAAKNAPAALASVTQMTRKPESFGADPLTDLALAAARFRLQAEPPAEAMATVPDLLWHAAVRIEDGNLTLAEQRLATAEQSLRDALEKGAPQEEINKKISELQQALADYQKAKTEKQENNFAANQGTPPDIQKMMEQLKQMNEMGAKEGAKQQLAELQDRLQEMRDENMDLENESAPAKAAQKLLAEMQDLTKSQASLIDRNFDKARAEELRRQQRQGQNQAQNGQNQNQRPNNTSNQRQDDAQQQQSGADAAQQQEALRQELARLNEQIRQMAGKPQGSMDEAGDAMAEARDHLKAGSWKNGVEAQSRALSKLQESAEQAQQDLAEAMFNKGFGGMMEQAGTPQFRFGQGQRGRAAGNNNDVDVPMGEDPASMASRVRAILEEIRTRASDRTRPAEEQDYLKRLMKQF
ncbi:MAG: DUF4175 domain-containing protein [Rhodospirillaceae bacterium]|nr:DUF4175 domain-containing protein [Rhodospirillaceae bacterium]